MEAVAGLTEFGDGCESWVAGADAIGMSSWSEIGSAEETVEVFTLELSASGTPG